MSARRLLPSSPEAERAVLAAVLLEPSLLAGVQERLGAEDFYLERHRLVYRAMLALRADSSPIDVRTLQARLEQAGELEAAGGLSYLATMDADLPDLGRIGAYLDIVLDRALRRRAITGARGLIQEASEGSDGGELVSKVTRLGEVLQGLRQGAEVLPMGDVVEAALFRLEDREPSQGSLGVPTGIRGLDQAIGGLHPGRQVVIAGRTGMGKTSLALNVAAWVACEEREPVLLYSLEMTPEELALKLLSARARVPWWVLEEGVLSEKEWERLQAATRDLLGAPLMIARSPRVSVDQIEAQCRAQAVQGLRAVVVDYFQILDFGPTSRRLEAMTDASRRLMLLARELGTTSLVLAQLNRETERRSDRRPQLADLAWCGAIEQDAAAVCLCYRPELYEPQDPALRGRAELIVAKNRFGPVRTVPLRFDGALGRFSDALPEEAPF